MGQMLPAEAILSTLLPLGLLVALGIAIVLALIWSRVSRLERRLRRLDQPEKEKTGPTSKQAPPPRAASPPAGVRDSVNEPAHQTAPIQSTSAIKDQSTPKAYQPSPTTHSPVTSQSVAASEEEASATLAGASSSHTDTSQPHEPAASNTAPARETKTVEERLGTKVFIWIGGIALVLAGAFLVKYSFENALLPPSVRVLLGTLFGGALLAGGEFMRKRSARIGEALTGAGVADLFGCLLAATTLYSLIGPVLAFVFMAILTGGAVILSLRHGQFVALLGLIGGFATPPLIGGGQQATLPLLGYLLLLEIGMTAVTRRRGWIGLTALTFVGSIVWAGVLAALGLNGIDRFALQAFLIGSAAVYVVGATRFTADEAPVSSFGPLTPIRIATTAIGAVVVFIGALVASGDFALTDFVMLGLLGAGVMVLARIKASYAPMAWLAGTASALTLVAFAIRTLWGTEPAPVSYFGWLVAGFGFLYAGGSYLAMWRSPHAAWWASGSVVAGVGYLIVGRIGLFDVATADWFAWWPIALALAVVYAAGALPVWRKRSVMVQGERTLAAISVGSGVLLAISAQMGLEYPWQLSAWAGIVALSGGLVRWQAIAGLRTFGLTLAVLTTAGAFIPGPTEIAHGTTVIFNALLSAYALPAIGLGLGAWCLRDRTPCTYGQVLRLFALTVGGVGVLVLIRQGFHPANLAVAEVGLYEWATYAAVSLIAAHGLLIWDRVQAGWPQRAVGFALAGIGAFSGLVGTVLLANPVHQPAALGSWPILNALLYIYGLPAVLLALLTIHARRYTDRAVQLPQLAASGALILFAVFLGLQVRHGFHGSAMGDAIIGLFEWSTYAVVYLLTAHTFLGLDRLVPGTTKRAAGTGFAILGTGAAVLGAGLIANPLWQPHAVGPWPVLNGLLYIYGLPAILIAYLARPAEQYGQQPVRLLIGFLSLALVFGLVSLEVRQGFVGSVLVLEQSPVSMAEWYGYSLAWVILGIALVLAGIRFKSSALRYGSLVVMLLAIGKVFLLDTARLDDLYRVLSLLGLGLSLLGLGYLYQRYVFRRPGERVITSTQKSDDNV
jgi:uncharacterized membrane protein